MPNDSPEDNRVYCKAYYERMKLDPQRLADRQAKKAAAQKARRAKQRGGTCGITVASKAVSPEKTSESACDITVTSTPKKLPSKEDLKALYEERAAIMENDGGLSKEAAEDGALDEILKMLGAE